MKFFDGYEERELGKTACKRNTLNPEWRDEVFTLSINASIEVENTRLLIDMFDCDIGPAGQDIPGDYLGCVELTGTDIEYLIADGKTHEVVYDLKPRPESAPHDDQEGYHGSIAPEGRQSRLRSKLYGMQDACAIAQPYFRGIWCRVVESRRP